MDVFHADPDGRYKGTKAAVTSFNAVADVLTIGMWEAVATPAEMLTQHKLTTYVVSYAPDERVESIRTTMEDPQQLQADARQPAAAAAPAASATAVSASTAAAAASAVSWSAHPAEMTAAPLAAVPRAGAEQAAGVALPSSCRGPHASRSLT